MKCILFLCGLFLFGSGTMMAQGGEYSAPELFGKQLPSSVISMESNSFNVPASDTFSPGFKWWKQQTFAMTDGNGGYTTYVVYDKWLTSGRHFDSYLEISPTCANAFRYPTPSYNAGDLAGVLLTGIFSDILQVDGRIKVGKKAYFSFY